MNCAFIINRSQEGSQIFIYFLYASPSRLALSLSRLPDHILPSARAGMNPEGWMWNSSRIWP